MKILVKAGLALVASLVVFSFSHEAYAQHVSPVTGRKLVKICGEDGNVKFCDSYLAGITDGAAWSQNFGVLVGSRPATAFCIPRGVQGDQIRSLVFGWFAGHEDALTQPAGRSVYRALHDNYTCPSGMASMYIEQRAEAQRVSSLQGSGLLKLCSHLGTAGMCDGYLAGTMDSEAWSRNYNTVQGAYTPVAFCVPESMKTPQIRSLIVGWFAGHQDALAEPAGRGVYRALHDNYPCTPAVAPLVVTRPGGNR